MSNKFEVTSRNR